MKFKTKQDHKLVEHWDNSEARRERESGNTPYYVSSQGTGALKNGKEVVVTCDQTFGGTNYWHTLEDVKQYCKKHKIAIINYRSHMHDGKTQLIISFREKKYATFIGMKWGS